MATGRSCDPASYKVGLFASDSVRARSITGELLACARAPLGSAGTQRWGRWCIGVAGTRWRDRIQRYIAESALLVVILGKTEGLAFEYRVLAEMKRLRSAVLVCPPGDVSDRRERWSTCRSLFCIESSGVTPAVTERALAGMIIPGGGLRLVVCRWRDAESYRVALEHLVMSALSTGSATAANV